MEAGKTPHLALDALCKNYGDTRVVDNVSLSIEAGEFITILGPSGSGKTTTLMMIAGFVYPTQGRLFIEGRDITYMPPHLRNIGMVFQNYALFPHLSLAENIAFPLQMRKCDKTTIAERVDWALSLVRLSSHKYKQPSELSGGQQQRVALARALVYDPTLLLMDEPLGALDKALREHMQMEILRIQEATGVTILYVTHDQDEALAMSDRVIVMKDGRINAVASPEALYRMPSDEFVANFVGETNLLYGRISSVSQDACRMDIEGGLRATVHRCVETRDRADVVLSLRPEHVRCTPISDGKPDGDNVWPARVESVVYLGSVLKYRLAVQCQASTLTVVAKDVPSPGKQTFGVGDQVFTSWHKSDAWLITDPEVVSEGA